MYQLVLGIYHIGYESHSHLLEYSRRQNFMALVHTGVPTTLIHEGPTRHEWDVTAALGVLMTESKGEPACLLYLIRTIDS